MAFQTLDTNPQDTRLSDALGQQYDKITQFLNENANPAPNPTEIGRAALSSSFGGTNYYNSISDMVANRQKAGVDNLSMGNDAIGLLVKRNELLASQGHPSAAALQDALKTIGFEGWDATQQQKLFQAIQADPEKLDENNALDMVVRHSQGIDLSPQADLPTGYEMGPNGPQLAPWYVEGQAKLNSANRQPREDNLVQVLVDGVPTYMHESEAAGLPAASAGSGGPGFAYPDTVRLPDGTVTQSRFNKFKGELEIKVDDENGEEIWMAAPPGTVSITQSSVSNSTMTAKDFTKLHQDIVNDQVALGNLNRFMGTVSDIHAGYRQLADQFTGLMKTVMGENNLSTEEFASLIMKGELQTLLGQNRIAIVGGGVMTEYDAERVLQAIIGATGPGGIINPTLVEKNLEYLFGAKQKQLTANAETYNANIEVGNQAGNQFYKYFKPIDPKEIQFEGLSGGDDEMPDYMKAP